VHRGRILIKFLEQAAADLVARVGGTMYVSQESVEQTRSRLLKVIAAAKVRFFEGAYCFLESPVGWLASHMKQTLGSGVFVVCGQNHRQGGIFDYWGCPWDLKDRFFAEVGALRKRV
jgi:hypothetical protein